MATRTPKDLRIGNTFYLADLRALRALVAELRDREIRVKRTYLLRALAHFVGADEMFAHALTRNRAEQAGKVASEGTPEHIPIMVMVDDVDKMEAVGDRLSDKGLRGGRSFILRSLIHAPWDLDHLVREVKKFQTKFPDPRTREGRQQQGR